MRDVFLVTVLPLGRQFSVAAGQHLWRAALEAGVLLHTSCRNGTCRECRCVLVEGEVSYTVPWPGLSAEERAEGWILPCVAVAETDLVLDAPGAKAFQPSTGPSERAT